jgi:steroid 5-alpha reductase family enzyme
MMNKKYNGHIIVVWVCFIATILSSLLLGYMIAQQNWIMIYLSGVWVIWRGKQMVKEVKEVIGDDD